jgi:rod shape determining protein RodA
MTFVMMYGAGVPLRMLGVMAAIALVALGCVLGAVFLPAKLGAEPELQAKIMAMTGLSDYQRNRIMVFFKADEDPLGAGWNKLQSEIAVGSGGLWGKGFRNGTQNILGFLPRTVAPNDFIYSVIAEETGFMGSMGLFALFGMVFWGGMRAAMSARDKLGRLLCVGIVAMLFSHVFINIAMTVGLMPITGLPLPLLSYGGSFTLVVMSALGLMQSVHIRSRRVVY